jgi:hypothetical protein
MYCVGKIQSSELPVHCKYLALKMTAVLFSQTSTCDTASYAIDLSLITHPTSQVVSHLLISGNLSVFKWRNGNFINNWTPLIFFVLFDDYQSAHMFACMDASFRNV